MLASIDSGDVTAIFTAVISLGVFITAYQIYDSRKAANAETARQLSQRWADARMEESRRLVNTYQNDNAALLRAVHEAVRTRNYDLYLFTRYLDFFEELGAVYKFTPGALKIIDSLLGSTVIQSWETWEPIIKDVWKNQPNASSNFRELAKALKYYREWKAMSIVNWPEERLRRF